MRAAVIGLACAAWAGTARADTPRPTLAELGLCPGKKVALDDVVPARGDFVALAESTARRATVANPAATAAMEPLVAAQKARAAASLAAPVLAGKDTSTALFVTARAALKDPSDPVVASNLGVLLAARGELAASNRALLHAGALAPGAPLVTVNRAWTLYRAGDAAGARALFEKQPELASSKLGLSLLDACAGGGGGGAPGKAQAIREALEARPSPGGEEAVAAVDPKQPFAYRDEDPELPDPPISMDIDNAPEDGKAAKLMAQATAKRIAELGPRMAVIKRIPGDQRQKDRYGALHQILSHRVRDELERFNAEVQPLMREMWDLGAARLQAWGPRMQACGGDTRCGKQVEYEMCIELKEKGEALHPRMFDAIDGGWRRMKPLLVDEWAYSIGMLKVFQNPGWIEQLQLLLEVEVVSAYHQYVMAAASWNQVATGVLRAKCRPPPPPPEPREAKVAALDADEEGLCSDEHPVVEIDTGIQFAGTSAAMELDCFKVKIELKRGELGGWMGYLAFDPMQGELTVFGGRWGGVDVPSSEAVLEARVGWFMTYRGEHGPTSTGIEGEGSAVGPGGAGWEAEFQIDAVALLGGPPGDAAAERKFFTGDLSPKFAVGE
jgi:hypothetical protein